MTKTPILALDPSGTSTTGLFYFENWSKWEITSITTENWLEQGEKLENYLKNKQVQVLACEVSSMWKRSQLNKSGGCIAFSPTFPMIVVKDWNIFNAYAYRSL